MSKKLLMLTCASSAMTLMWGGSALAATAAATDTAAADQGAASVTEIVVQAEHREQSLQRVPVAVSVFTGQQRDTIGINSVQDVTNFAPGFTYDPANVHAYIRGVGRQSVNVTDDQRVANYEDGFYVYSPYGLGRSSLFLAQEQIERGPQNVGGRNAAAGSIDMIYVRPTDQPYAEVRATIGNFQTYKLEAAMSGTIAPNLTARVAGYYSGQETGYFKNLGGLPSEGNVVHDYYLEGQLEWKPTDQFDLWVHGYAATWNGRGNAGSRLGYSNGSWDETNLTDANAYVGGGLFVNPNYGYAALTGVHAPGDPLPTQVTLLNPAITNNPAITTGSVYNFVAPIQRDVKLANYDDFNWVATYHFPTFDVKYNGGVQGYGYRLNYSGTDTNVLQFTLPGSNAATVAALNNVGGLFGAPGHPFPGCAAGSALCGGPGSSALPAGITIPTASALVIDPMIEANYVEDDIWTAHDINFTSTDNSPLQWTGGAFFFYQHYNQPYEVKDPEQSQLQNPFYAPPAPIVYPGVGVVGFSAGLPAPVNTPRDFLYLDYKFNVMSVAGYGQVSYKINDQWRITGNLRYSYDDKWGVENARYLFMGSAIIDGYQGVFGANTPALDITPSQTCLSGVPGHCNDTTHGLGKGVRSMGVILPNGYAQRQLELTSSAVTGGAGIEFTPTPDIFTYFRYGRGYEAPSFNAGQILANPGVAPEFLNSFEVGYKQTFGHSLLVDIAAFYYDYEGLQLPISVANGGVTQSQFVNVPKALSEGVELEAYWTPVRDLSVTFSYSYDHSEILTGCNGTVTAGVLTPAPNALCLIDTNDPHAVQPGANNPGNQTSATIDQSIKGNPLPNAPEHKLAINVAYTWNFDPGSLTASATYDYRSTQTGAVFNRFYYVAPSWDNVDLRLLWKGQKDKYEIIGYVKNVFNTLQYDVGATGVGLLGNRNQVTTAGAGLFETSILETVAPRTFGVEVRYKFF